MNLYIHGTGILSAAGNNNEEGFLSTHPNYDTDRLLCKEPDYSAYISPMQLRRMSKAVRMGIGAARICLDKAGVEAVDAIVVGTAYGCLSDTETFLSKMVDQNEQMLTPTAFIQSTHNTVAGQIALITQCHGHNLTYVHRGHSFEHAMINASIYLDEYDDESILIGGIEELTETSIGVLKHAKVYRRATTTAKSVLTESEEGSIAGEGATFFVAKSKPSAESLHVKNITTFTTRNPVVAVQRVREFLNGVEDGNKNIDLVMFGVNGDVRSEQFYTELKDHAFPDTSQAAFKHLCGEYPVAVAFGLGMLVNAISNGLPEHCILNFTPANMKRVLLINNYLHHYSCWYLEVV